MQKNTDERKRKARKAFKMCMDIYSLAVSEIEEYIQDFIDEAETGDLLEYINQDIEESSIEIEQHLYLKSKGRHLTKVATRTLMRQLKARCIKTLRLLTTYNMSNERIIE